MKTRHITPLGVAIFLGAVCTPIDGWGQADAFWLKSWNEAQEGRPSTMRSSGRIAEESEPGQPLIIHGQVFDPDGASADGVVVHAYHRDREGFDFGPNDDSLATWRLQGWVKTNAVGRFEYRTIRPAPDHLGREGAHIHFTLESDDYGLQWAPTVYLADDPLVSRDQRSRSREAGEFGWVQDVETKDGVQHIDVTIRLKQAADF